MRAFRLALISLMQFLEGLSDRQAADAVRGRIDWKYLVTDSISLILVSIIAFFQNFVLAL